MVVCLPVQQNPLDGAGITALQDDNSAIHPPEPQEGDGCRGASMDPWVVPWGAPRSCAKESNCQGRRGRAYEKPSVWVARWPLSPRPTQAPTFRWTSWAMTSQNLASR